MSKTILSLLLTEHSVDNRQLDKMSDWSSIHGMSVRSGLPNGMAHAMGLISDGESYYGSIRSTTDVDSLPGTSMRDVDSMQGEAREHESNIILSSVADAMEKLRISGHDAEKKEEIAVQLSELAEASVDARAAIGYHAQAIPLLVGLLRSGTLVCRTHAAKTLSSLCIEDELRVKVLLGGCIPPLLALLNAAPKESQMAAAEALFAVSKGGPSRDSVGTKIFATEGVVPALLERLQPEMSVEIDVLGLVTGTLRNLCYTVENFWPMTMAAGGVEIFASLLSSGRPMAQENSAALLTSFTTSPLLLYSRHQQQSVWGSEEDPAQQAADNAARVEVAGAVGPLLRLLETGSVVPLRTEAAGTLRALSGGNLHVKEAIAKAGGVGVLIRATVAPSAEMMQTGYAQMLQENAMGALANIAGGKPQIVMVLAEAMEQPHESQVLADTIGALAYALMIVDSRSEGSGAVDSAKIEDGLVQRLQDDVPTLVQERAIEALASLYGNAFLAGSIRHGEAKKMLVGLITLSTAESRPELIRALVLLCTEEADLWTALNQRDGVLLLVGLLGLSTEEQQEYSCSLLHILTEKADDSKWAITAAGGIPPLVQLLGTGTLKAKEDAAAVLGNLCGFSEDIRACVETAEATPALLSLLGNGTPKGQQVSARALMRLVSGSSANSSTIGHLSGLLGTEVPESKGHVLRVLGHLLEDAADVAQEGSASNQALHALVGMLSSEREESQEVAAMVLANLFAAREDLRESSSVTEAIGPLVLLVDVGVEQIAVQAARALAAVFCSIDTNHEAAQVAGQAVRPLLKLAKSPEMKVAEVATTALANLLANEELAQSAPGGEVILPLSRLLSEGSAQGKEHAAGALAHLLQRRVVDDELADSIKQCSTVLELVALLAAPATGEEATMAALEALAALARARTTQGFALPLLQVLAEMPQSILPLAKCLAFGTPLMQEKAIEVLSRLCKDQPVVLGNLIASSDGCIPALMTRITNSSSQEVKIGGTALLICAAKEHRESTMQTMSEAGTFLDLIQCLVEMLSIRTPEEPEGAPATSFETELAASATLANSVALWMLAVVALHDNRRKLLVAQAGAIEVLTEKLAVFAPNARAMDALMDHNGGSWVSAMLLAILFRDRDVTRMAVSTRAIPPLANLLHSEEPSDRYFAAQALSSLVLNGSRGTLLAVANSGATAALIAMLGNPESDISSLVALSDDFSLARNPEHVALERLFRCDDIREGATARKAIPALVKLLSPMPDRPGAPPLALGLLTQVATGDNSNKVAMAENGALEALTRYLSIGPQESFEQAAAELLRILFSSEDLRGHPTAMAAVEQLVAVLRLGSRGARLSAARALEGLFVVDAIRASELSLQAIEPMVEMLASGNKNEQHAAVVTLAKLAAKNGPKIMAIVEGEGNAIDALCQIFVSSEAPLKLKEDAVELLRLMFALGRVRSSAAASGTIGPLVELLSVEESHILQFRAALALDQLLDDEAQGENVAAAGAVIPLVVLLQQDGRPLHLTVASALFKLAKDRRLCKLDMTAAGVIERILEILPDAGNGLAGVFMELLRVLTNNSSIARGQSAGSTVEPIFAVLRRQDLDISLLNSALQTLSNVLRLEKPDRLQTLHLEPSQALEPLLPLLTSESQAVQQLAAGLVAHLLTLESFQRDSLTMAAVPALTRLLASDHESLLKEGLKALHSASNSWPNAIAEAGGIEELSRLVAAAPQPIWQSAATVLSSVLQSRDRHYMRVPIPVLVRLLLSNTEQIQKAALDALLRIEKEDSAQAEIMAQRGVIEALLDMLGSHHLEEMCARLLEALFCNARVRAMPIAARALASLCGYLLDPEARDLRAKLLTSLALGDLFQEPALARGHFAATAARALVGMLMMEEEEELSGELQVVAISSLQNLVIASRNNKRHVAESGGISIILELLAQSPPDVTSAAAGLVGRLFNSHTIQEYATPDIVATLTAVLARELQLSHSADEEVVRAIETLMHNFTRLRVTEEATAAISPLVGAMRVGNEEAQEAALSTLSLLRQGWGSATDVARAQAAAAGEAIPVLQLMLRSGPIKLYEKAEALLAVLPGSFTVTLKRGSNLKAAMGSTNAFCKVTLGEGPPRLTKVVPQCTDPEWQEALTWPLAVPPTGQKLQVSCKTKTSLGKGSLGKVVIQIDRVVTLGTISGTYALVPDMNKDGSQRALDIDFVWSNR